MNNENLSFPVLEPKELDNLSSSHDVVQGIPFNERALSYKLILPKGWVSEKDLGRQEAGAGRLVKIGLFAERLPRNPAVVQVFYTSMPFEIGLLDWLDYHSELTGIRAVSSRMCIFACGDAADVAGFYGSADNQFVVRSVAFVDGARIFVVSAMIKKERYQGFEKQMAIATNFFQLLHPTGGTIFEPWLKVDGKNPDFSLAHPASWSARQISAKLPGKSAVDVFLAKDEKMLAYLRVKATDPLIAGNISVEQKQVATIRELQDAQVKVQSSWEPEKRVLQENAADKMTTFKARATLSEAPIEVRLCLTKSGAIEFATTLISVTKESDRMLWIRSMRAYDIALATLTSHQS